MEFKGTKGKWVHTKCYDHHIEVDGKIIVTIHCLESGKPKFDGRLISKAPDILAMLIDISDELRNGDTPHLYKIEELIKKATTL